jgi:hypothetical protein
MAFKAGHVTSENESPMRCTNFVRFPTSQNTLPFEF